MNSILVFGYKGKLLRAGTHEEILVEDELIRNAGTGYPHLTHHAEVSFLQSPEALPSSTMDSGYAMLLRGLEPIYQRYGKYGDFGDVLFVNKISGFYYLTAIGKKSYRLPAFAADLLPVVIDGVGNKFFLGIVRGDNGEEATIGGFMDVKDCELESAPECLTHEAWEEIGLQLRLVKTPSYDIASSPFPDSASVEFSLLGETNVAQMTRLGIFYSPESNLRPQFQTKRVHVAAAYVLPIHLKQVVTIEQLRAALIPQDKAENNKIFVFPVDDSDPGFMIGHKHMYDLARDFVSS